MTGFDVLLDSSSFGLVEIHSQEGQAECGLCGGTGSVVDRLGGGGRCGNQSLTYHIAVGKQRHLIISLPRNPAAELQRSPSGPVIEPGGLPWKGRGFESVLLKMGIEGGYLKP